MKYNKEQIKDLILTDYIDGCLDETIQKEIKGYIQRDPELQEFLQAVLKTSSEPFEHLPAADVPEYVWHNIKDQIEKPKQEIQSETIFTNFMQRLQVLWEQPRLSFAFGSGMAVLIIFMWISVGQRYMTNVQYSSEQQVEYLMFLVESDELNDGEEQDEFDTTIESYFL